MTIEMFCQVLALNGGKLDLADHCNMTCLHYACKNGHSDVVKFLLNHSDCNDRGKYLRNKTFRFKLKIDQDFSNILCKVWSMKFVNNKCKPHLNDLNLIFFWSGETPEITLKFSFLRRPKKLGAILLPLSFDATM